MSVNARFVSMNNELMPFLSFIIPIKQAQDVQEIILFLKCVQVLPEMTKVEFTAEDALFTEREEEILVIAVIIDFYGLAIHGPGKILSRSAVISLEI
jgi:hypothetical protein